MYCATFYSYKGGVGRTLALANVAAYLSVRGKRVLVVDFDLEAPGLTTLDICADARGRPGMVDYIHSYLANNCAPTAADYIHRCKFKAPDNDEELELHVMPAGNQDAAYGASFAKIDWRELYEERDGFLLMEELRAEWSNLGFDYVLIDSRTGLTDASGICTRQLPDGVVLVFFPNEQNLIGLQEMVRSIRTSTARPTQPDLLFVASRLPRLDDEYGVLERWLSRFKTELRYDRKQLSMLEHYDSLSLLDQDIFVLSRPRTELSKQYGNLASLIAQLNVADAQGACAYVNAVIKMYSTQKLGDEFFEDSNPFSFAKSEARLAEIEKVHQNDSVIQRALSEHYYSMRDFAHLEVVLRHGIAAGGATQVEESDSALTIPRLFQLQMRMTSDTGELKESKESALSLLDTDGANEQMVLEALMLLIKLDSNALPPVASVKYIARADLRSVVGLMNKLGISSREVDYNCKIAIYAMDRFGLQIEDGHKSPIVLALIAGGEFERALVYLGDDSDPRSLDKADIPDAFNRLMAFWGRDGRPNGKLFRHLLPRLEDDESLAGGTNFEQCLALLYAAVGDTIKCEEHLKTAENAMAASSGRREVSCWSFVEEPEDEFLRHCKEIRRLGEGEPLVPIFVGKRSASEEGSVSRQ